MPHKSAKTENEVDSADQQKKNECAVRLPDIAEGLSFLNDLIDLASWIIIIIIFPGFFVHHKVDGARRLPE
jgi:hypothetical protein